jgi:phenylacetate-coenzyme A ligase PaaK-like adenylate-forming protein
VIIDSPRRREQLAAVAERLPAHVSRLAWSKDQIKAKRQRALHETLAFAKARSAWHAKRLSGLDAESFTEADLARLPVMTKADVMSNWDELVTDRRLTLAGCNANITGKLEGSTKDYYYLDDYLVIATGGSSGVRGVFPWSWDEFIEIACATFRYQLRDEPPERLSGRTLLAVIEAGEIVHGSPFLFSVSTDPAARVQWFPADTPHAAQVAALNDAQPTQINCYGSVMEELGAEALSGRLEISPHRVTTNSEPAVAGDTRCCPKSLGRRDQQYVGLCRDRSYRYRMRRPSRHAPDRRSHHHRVRRRDESADARPKRNRSHPDYIVIRSNFAAHPL